MALLPGITADPQEFPGSAVARVALTFPALFRFRELARPRLPPVRKLLLQIDGPVFNIREPLITIIDRIFELLARRHHP
jgi:hypothetical protein